MRINSGARMLTAAVLILALCSGPPAVRPSSAGGRRTEEAAGGRSGGRAKKPTVKQAAKDFVKDAADIWSAPFRLKDKHVGPLVVLAAATGVLIAADEDIRDAFKNFSDENGWVGDVSPVVTQVGGVGAWGAAGLFFGAGLVFKDGRARDTGLLAAGAMVQSFLVTHTLKGFTGRRRPFIADGEDRWSGPGGFFKRYDPANDGLWDSFPSGHAATAFSLATVVALRYRHRPWVPVLAYSLAGVAAVSRVTEDRHWMSDVLVGAVIGHLVARLVVHNHGRRQRLVPVVACAGRSFAFGFQYALDPAY